MKKVISKLKLTITYLLPIAFVLLVTTFSCTDVGDKDKDKASTEKEMVITDTSSKKLPEADKLVSPKAETDILTIANIRTSADGKTIQVLFNERAQVFNFDAADKATVTLLKDAYKKNEAVKIDLDASTEKINTAAKLLPEQARDLPIVEKIKGAKSFSIDVNKIDTLKFNDVKEVSKALLGCNNWVIPNYATAVTIFNYCAKNSCNLPGPYTVSPCIPFQYVKDGCYARAHKMRYIIENVYRYCTQKVFSFANSGNKTLAVRAAKWGNCCVKWWYHVAPLVIVNINGVNKYYVIDPGMFNTPVPWATWFAAQANTGCATNAGVTMYSIQPSTAYAPANYTGTSFSTDPNYTATNATLTNYRYLKTCP
jgi:Glutaminase